MTIDYTVQPQKVFGRKTNLHFFSPFESNENDVKQRIARRGGRPAHFLLFVTVPAFLLRLPAAGSEKFAVPAGGTSRRFSGPERFLPVVAASHARKRALLDPFDNAPLDAKSQPIDQYPGNLAPGALDYSSECLARNIHLLRGFLVINAFEVSQSEGFEFVDCERDRF